MDISPPPSKCGQDYACLIQSCCFCYRDSAGVGRTGVFITLSIVLERMRYEGVVDIFQTVKMLRTQRPAMVQTEVRKISMRLFCIKSQIIAFITQDPPRIQTFSTRGKVQENTVGKVSNRLMFLNLIFPLFK